jgi:hypothetical protein
MSRTRNRRQVKLPKFRPKLDLDEFNALTDLLFETCKEKHQTCAKLLGISVLTWRKWEQSPPGWPYWNLVLRYVIREYLGAMEARRGLTRSHRLRIRDRLQHIERAEELDGEITAIAQSLSGAQRHIRLTLGGKGMFWDELRLPANCGGYSPRTLRKAARTLEVVMTQEGYGQHKRSYWRMPTEYDD